MTNIKIEIYYKFIDSFETPTKLENRIKKEFKFTNENDIKIKNTIKNDIKKICNDKNYFMVLNRINSLDKKLKVVLYFKKFCKYDIKTLFIIFNIYIKYYNSFI